MLAAEAPAAPNDAIATCRALHTDQDRLACYDKLFGSPEGAMIEQTPSPPARQPVAVREDASLLDQRWELSDAQKQGTFRVSPYKPVYILAATYASSRNPAPRSPSKDHEVGTPLDIRHAETKYQLGLKSKLWETILGQPADLWFGYTQSSRWQLYNPESRPFRETDYEPEFMLTYRTNYQLLGWDWRLAGVNFTHQSNGREVPLSRSWNRVVGQFGLDRPGWSIMVRPWWRVHEDRSSDDNPDIEDFMGRGDLWITHNFRGHEISAMFRHSLRGGNRSHGAMELNWAFPIHGELKGYLQFFSGYGESLIDYNHTANYVGLGVSLVEWYSHTAETTRY